MTQQAIPGLNLLAGGPTAPKATNTPATTAPGVGIAFETLIAAQQVNVTGTMAGENANPEALLENGPAGLLSATQNATAYEHAAQTVLEALTKNDPTAQLPQLDPTQQGPGLAGLVHAVKAELAQPANVGGNAPVTETNSAALGTQVMAQSGEQVAADVQQTIAPNSGDVQIKSTTLATDTQTSATGQTTATKTQTTSPANDTTLLTQTQTAAGSATGALGSSIELETVTAPAPTAEGKTVLLQHAGEQTGKPAQSDAKPAITHTAQLTKPENPTQNVQLQATQTPVANRETLTAQNNSNATPTDQRASANTAANQGLMAQLQAQAEPNSLRQPSRPGTQSSSTQTDDPSETTIANKPAGDMKKAQIAKPANAATSQNGPKLSNAFKPTGFTSLGQFNASGLYAVDGLESQIVPQQTAELGVQAARSAGTMQIAPGIKLPVNLIAVNIAQHASQNINKFEMRLDPPELGRVEVKMEMTSDGKVTAHLTAERAETLELLQRDARALERALNDTGLSADKDALSFSLKDQAFNGASDDQNNPQDAAGKTQDDDTPKISEAAMAHYKAFVSADGVDIRI